MGKKHLKRTKLIFSIICIIALSFFVVFVLVYESKADEKVAKTFLTQYYTAADDSGNMQKLLCDVYDSGPMTQEELEEGIDSVLQCAYGTCVSHDTLEVLMADRILFASDELAMRTGVTITCLDVVLNEKTDTSQEENDYTYSVDVYIENAYGNCTQIVLQGVVNLERETNDWKVTGFYPEDNLRMLQLELKRPEVSQSTGS